MKYQFGNWVVEVQPQDGARLTSLKWKNLELLNKAPESFRPPDTDYGKFETRPVFGYDDCFPSLAPCRYPETDWMVPDHGELCWLDWDVNAEGNCLECMVRSKVLPVHFIRKMKFEYTGITWDFSVCNYGDRNLPFQHAMHPLMPPQSIEHLILPAFSSISDEMTGDNLTLDSPEEVSRLLLQQQDGQDRMLMLRGVEEGLFQIGFKDGACLKAEYPAEMFGTLGIWWNTGGYPDEDGCRRYECAFEPIPGSSSSLDSVYEEGKALLVNAGSKLNWQVTWQIT